MDKSTKDRKKLFRARRPEGQHVKEWMGLPTVTEEQGPHRGARPEQQTGGLLQHQGGWQGKWQQNHRRAFMEPWSWLLTCGFGRHPADWYESCFLIDMWIPDISCRTQMSLFYQVELIKPGADLNWPSLPLEDAV